MVIYLYGADSYRRSKKLKELLEQNKKKQPNTDVLFVDFLEDPDAWKKAKDFLNQPSMFSESKTLVVYESGEVSERGEKEWLKTVKEYLEEKKVFIIISDSWDKPRKAFMFLIELPVKAQEFAGLEGRTLDAFLRKEASVLGLRFESDAWTHFVKHIESATGKSWAGVHELQKIALARYNAPISKNDVESIIEHMAQIDVFNSARELMGPGKIGKRIATLERLLAQGEDSARLFNLLAYNARGAHAVRLADLDIAIKSGQADYEEALLEFVLGGQ